MVLLRQEIPFLQSGPKVLDHSGIFISDFPPLPIFSVDPHCTGMDSTIMHNIETGGGKGEFHF